MDSLSFFLLIPFNLHFYSVFQSVSYNVVGFSECGAAFTSKLEGMFKDMELSKDISLAFRQVDSAHSVFFSF